MAWTPVFPEAVPVGALTALSCLSRSVRVTSIAIPAAIGRPRINDPHDSIGNHRGMAVRNWQRRESFATS
jgi:hypothetical protein